MNETAGRRERCLRAAEGYLGLDMPDHALRELRRIEQPELCAREFYQIQGEALRQKGRYEQALEVFGRALAEDPTNAGVLLGMAWCYKRTGRLPQAIDVTEQAYRASPTEPIILYNLACYFSLAGNKTQALSWLGRALRMERNLTRLISDESDFDRLRADADFQMLVQTVAEAVRR
ncbi:MAG: TPR end-of-group domain-containing protein [Planctomycetaceae bacterium]